MHIDKSAHLNIEAHPVQQAHANICTYIYTHRHTHAHTFFLFSHRHHTQSEDKKRWKRVSTVHSWHSSLWGSSRKTHCAVFSHSLKLSFGAHSVVVVTKALTNMNMHTWSGAPVCGQLMFEWCSFFSCALGVFKSWEICRLPLLFAKLWGKLFASTLHEKFPVWQLGNKWFVYLHSEVSNSFQRGGVLT